MALVATTVLVAAGFVPRLAVTSALLDDTTGWVSTTITTKACIGQAGAHTYVSQALDAAAPLLRWSFSGTLPAGTLPLPSPPTGATPADSGTSPAMAISGLLGCDPAELTTPAGTPGSLILTQGAGGALTASAPTTLGASFTWLLWTSLVPGAHGELASLTGASGDLMLGVSAGAVQLTYPTSGGPVTTPAVPLPDGAAHLVAVTFTGSAVDLVVDGVASPGATTSWATGASILAVGAPAHATNAGAAVDEVTVLGTAYSAAQLADLVDLDHGPASWPVP